MGFRDIFTFSGKAADPISLHLYNTLSKEKQVFTLAPNVKSVRMYNCGPTVYGRQHIGNLSMFVFTDILRRVLKYNDLEVKQTINITDFGHLTSDADEGEDKMLKGLKREKLRPSMANMKVLADKFTNIFLEDIRSLNVEVDSVAFPRASEYIEAQIAMIKSLEEKSYAYRAGDGVYYDTSRFPTYGMLGNINLGGQQEGARVDIKIDKRNPADFILWKSLPVQKSLRTTKMGWDSPWGRGFPGWHIECSAMARATLGEQIDIHTGGIEHIPVHHNNEIAQSEAATGKKPFSRFWMHRAHIQIEGGKISKSVEGSVVYLSDVTERGFHPLSLRYLFLGAHYRTSMNFTWEALGAAQTAYAKLIALRLAWKDVTPGNLPSTWKAFKIAVNDDLDTPLAIAHLWGILKNDDVSKGERLACLLDADKVLGLRLTEPDDAAKKLAESQMEIEIAPDQLPSEIGQLILERAEARKNKDWNHSDSLRLQIEAAGFTLKDSAEGTRVYKI